MGDPFYAMHGIGPEEEITTIRSARFFEELIEPIRQILENHGARLAVFETECVVSLPAGTVRQRLYPVVLTNRYKVTLPDGYGLYEHESIHVEGHTSVLFVLDEFPSWVQDTYGRVDR